MQERLTEAEAADCRKIAEKLGSVFDFDATDEGKEYWQGAVESLCKKWKHGTSDGKPWVEPEPPLTDKDACVHPRMLVMVRSDDSVPWEGPYAYLGKTESFYAVDSLAKTVFVLWGQARRATPAEIEAAK